MKKILVCFMALVLVLSNAALALDLGDMEDMFGGITSMFGPDTADAYGPQEVVEIGDISIELKDVLRSGKNAYYTPESGNEFLIIQFSIENNGAEDLTLSSMMSFSTWCDDELCMISLEALGTAMLSGLPQLDTVVESGASFTGVIGYEVSKDWDTVIVQYTDGIVLGNTVTFVVNND